MTPLAIAQLVSLFIPIVMKMIKGVEERALVENKPGAGAEKRAIVVSGVKETARGLVAGMKEVSTGGQKETWEDVDAITEPVIDLIDPLVALMYPPEQPSLFDRIKSWFS